MLERTRWSESIASSRTVALYTTLILYVLSLLRHGFLPAFFTLLVVYNGLSLSKVRRLKTQNANCPASRFPAHKLSTSPHPHRHRPPQTNRQPKVLIWSCIEVHRTLLPLVDSLQRHPVRTLGVLLAYTVATRTPSDAITLTLFVAAGAYVRAWVLARRRPPPAFPSQLQH